MDRRHFIALTGLGVLAATLPLSASAKYIDGQGSWNVPDDATFLTEWFTGRKEVFQCSF